MLRLLAQNVPVRSGTVTNGVLLWVGILIALTIVGGLLILQVRKRILGKAGHDDGGATMMEQLRRMRDLGQISEEEFESTRRRVHERMKDSLRDARSR